MVDSTCTTDQYGNKIYINFQLRLHQENGPAIEIVRANGDKFYFYHGKQYSEKDFNKIRQMANSLKKFELLKLVAELQKQIESL